MSTARRYTSTCSLPFILEKASGSKLIDVNSFLRAVSGERTAIDPSPAMTLMFMPPAAVNDRVMRSVSPSPRSMTPSMTAVPFPLCTGWSMFFKPAFEARSAQIAVRIEVLWVTM